MKKAIKKKKGFTLVELITVIVILGVLVGILIPVYSGISKRTKEKAYENLITSIKVASEKYASESSKLQFSVGELVKTGFIGADNDKDEVLSPIDKKSLNCLIVDVTQEEDIYYANVNETVNCDLAEDLEKIPTIKIKIETINGIVLEKNSWTKENVKLSATIENNPNNMTVENYAWFANNSVIKDQNKESITIEPQTIINTYYQLRVTFKDKDNKTYIANNVINVKIDKQNPEITGVNINNQNEWTPTNKRIDINATDFNGSGIASYYIGKNEDCKTSPISNESFTTLPNGQYIICVIDKIGNVSNIEKITISKVDEAPSVPKITASDNMGSGTWHGKVFNLSFKSTTNGSDITYYYGTTPSTIKTIGSQVQVPITVVNTTYYVKACSKTGLCSAYATYLANKDTIKPSIVIAPYDTNYVQSLKVTATFTDSESGIIAYAVTKSSAAPGSSDWITFESTKSISASITIVESNYYYFWAKDASGNTNYVYKSIYNIDNIPPEVYDVVIEEIWCDSSSFEFSVPFKWSDAGGSGINPKYEWQMTTSSTRPTSGWTTGSIYGLSCGVRYYAWIKATDNAGNVGYGRSAAYRCDACYWEDVDEPPTPPSSKPSSCPSGSEKLWQATLGQYWCGKTADAIVAKNKVCPPGYNGPHQNGTYCCASGYDYNTDFPGIYYPCINWSYGKPTCPSGKKLSSDYGSCS